MVIPETSMISASCGHSPAGSVVTASIRWSRITTVAPATGPAPVPSISLPPFSTFISALLPQLSTIPNREPIYNLEHNGTREEAWQRTLRRGDPSTRSNIEAIELEISENGEGHEDKPDSFQP